MPALINALLDERLLDERLLDERLLDESVEEVSDRQTAISSRRATAMLSSRLRKSPEETLRSLRHLDCCPWPRHCSSAPPRSGSATYVTTPNRQPRARNLTVADIPSDDQSACI